MKSEAIEKLLRFPCSSYSCFSAWRSRLTLKPHKFCFKFTKYRTELLKRCFVNCSVVKYNVFLNDALSSTLHHLKCVWNRFLKLSFFLVSFCFVFFLLVFLVACSFLPSSCPTGLGCRFLASCLFRKFARIKKSTYLEL